MVFIVYDYDVVIIGGGLVGFMVVIYIGWVQFSMLILEKGMFGGQIVWSEEVENFFGFFELIVGMEFVQWMYQQVEKFGVKVEMDEVQGVQYDVILYFYFFIVWGYNGEYCVKVVILVMGVDLCKFGIFGEDNFWGKGVSICVICDGFFYKGKKVVVIGGGDVVVEEGMFLIKFVDEVMVIYCCDML